MTLIDVRIAVAASVVACAAGAACGYFLTKQRMTDQYELLIEEEVKKAKDYYTEHPPVSPEDDIPEVEVVVVDETTMTESIESVDVEDPDEAYLRDKHIAYHKIAANYDSPAVQQAAKVKPNIGESTEAFENRLMQEAKNVVHALIDEVEPELATGGEVVTQNIFDSHGPSTDLLDKSTRSADNPFILSLDEYEANDLEYSQNQLTYFKRDHVLVDEHDQPVVTNTVIGENNLQFGVGSGDKNVVYIRNDKLEVDFEVIRSLGSYAEEVLGVEPSERRNTRE